MALAKSVPQPTGVVATYHRIVRGEADYETGKTTLELKSYVDAAARQAGAQALICTQIRVDALPDGDQRVWAYAQVKARSEWSDAQDV